MAKTSRAESTTNILLSLAWLGELDKTQAHRLCLPSKSIYTVENTLRALRNDGLVEPRAWHITVDGIPHEQPSLWSLTKKGHELIAGHDQYPPKPAPIGPKRLIGHDYRTIETIIRLVELARRSDFSGLHVQFEVRLDPTQPRPRMDALVIIQIDGGYDHTDLVPWSKDPAIDDETRHRFAIESDGDTEPIAVIEGKARAYRAVHRDASWRDWWRQQWGPLPFVTWVVPTSQRLDAVHAAWERVWPEGAWMLATEEGLRTNSWLIYAQRATRKMTVGGLRSKHPTPVQPRVLPPVAPNPVPSMSPAVASPVIPPAAPVVVQSAPPIVKPPSPPSQTPKVVPPVPTYDSIYSSTAPRIRLVTPSYDPLSYDPRFERPYVEPEGFPWGFTCKMGIGTVLLSALITFVLLFGVAIWAWTQVWAYTLLWVVAGSTLIGLVWWKRDTWWLGDYDVGRRMNRRTVLLGLTLLTLPTGFGQWTWDTFKPVPETPTPYVEEIIWPTETPTAVPTSVPTVLPAPTIAPTPATCGPATVAVRRGLRLRSAPGTTAVVIATLPQHTQVELLCDTQDVGTIRWAHVRVGEHEGWIAEQEGNQQYLVSP